MLFFKFSTVTLIYELLKVTVLTVSSSGQTGIQSRAENINSQITKRSNGLLQDMFDLTVNQKIERVKLQEEVAITKKTFDNALTEMKDMKKVQHKNLKDLKDNMEKMKQTMNQRLADMTKEQQKMSKKVTKLVTENTQLKKMKDNMQKMKETMNQRLSGMTKEQQKMSNKITKLESENKQLRNITGNLGDQQYQEIGFTVKLNTHKSIKGIMKFDTIISNYGNGYNMNTGMFTCKRSGLYMLSLTILSRSRSTQAKVVKNKTELATVFSSGGRNDGTWDTGSISVLVHLDVGDQVWAETVGGPFYFERRSYFTGALLSA